MKEAGNQKKACLPVIMVHGYLASPNLMLPLSRRLQKNGFDVHPVKLSLGAIQDVRALAKQLNDNVERLLGDLGQKRCDMIGVSQGGLIGLQYLHFHKGSERVRRFITLGAPVRGTWASLLGIPFTGLISRGIWQTLPGSKLIRELAGQGLPGSTEITTIAIDGDLVAPPETCRLEGANNIRIPGKPTPLTHQWLIFSTDAADWLIQALEKPRPS